MTSASMVKSQEQYSESQRSRDGSHHYYPSSHSYTSNGCHENLVYVMPSDSVETSNEEPITKNAGSRWREDETEALVEIWRDKICQTRWWKQSKGVRVNKEMWEEIAQLLAERDVFRTPSQCQIRMKNLLQYYRQTIDNKRAEKSWDELPEYFDIVDKIMSRRDTNGSISDENGLEDHDAKQRLQQNSYPIENEHSTNNEEEAHSTSQDAHHAENVEENNLRENRKRNHDNITTPNITVSAASRYGPYYQNYMRPVAPQYHPNCYNGKENFAQPHWVMNQSQCCDMTPHKRPCHGNDIYAHMMHYDNAIKARSQSYQNKQYLDLRSNETMTNNSENSLLPTVSSHSIHKTTNVVTPRDSNGIETPDSNNQNKQKETDSPTAIQIMQEFMQLQHKQMEHLLEVEKKRLEIEEKRLQEEKDTGSRNAAFLMEAVKLLAETFRNADVKKDCKTEKLLD